MQFIFVCKAYCWLLLSCAVLSHRYGIVTCLPFHMNDFIAKLSEGIGDAVGFSRISRGGRGIRGREEADFST